MLRDLSLIVSPILVTLLVVLTPVGTGQGAHRDQLLDPLFPHVHLAGPTPPVLARTVTERSPSPAIGAGAGAESASLGTGLTPPVPLLAALPPAADVTWRWRPFQRDYGGALADPPPDPPPTSA